jgi:hypothetical protein
MFNSTVLDVAIGLIFTFFGMSLAVSAIVEAVASALNWRSKTLLSGIKNLLNDQDFKGLALQIYNHALVNPQDPGNAQKEGDLKNPPSYMEPKQFANALVDVAKITQDSPDKIKAQIDASIKDRQLNSLLKGMVDRTAGHVDQIRDQIAGWFDNGMDRVSGAYKRNTQKWTFVIALVAAVVLNVSAINIGQLLWLQPMVAKTIPVNANFEPAEALGRMAGLGFPVGWSWAALNSLISLNGFEMLAGWVITAAATLFGAPFWFDLLQQFVRLKGSGPSPEEKRNGTGAAA